MSVFSVLKYPVSCPPGYEELSALPAAIFIPWFNWVKDAIHRKWYTFELSTEVLRNLVRDYEEPE